MGQFSWLDCKYNDVQHPILDDVKRMSFVLVPEEYKTVYGSRIEEECYDGYGRFGGYDIYDLVIDWNRNYLTAGNLRSDDPVKVEIIGMLGRGCSDEEIKDFVLSKKEGELPMFMKGDNWKRIMGVAVACYDEQNAALKYPIKITYDKFAKYEECSPSVGDPNQGWGYEESYDNLYVGDYHRGLDKKHSKDDLEL